jgi:hypothetical protein
MLVIFWIWISGTTESILAKAEASATGIRNVQQTECDVEVCCITECHWSLKYRSKHFNGHAYYLWLCSLLVFMVLIMKLQSADKHNACPERPLRYTRTCSTLSWRWEVSSGRKRRSPPLICGPSWPGVLRRLCCDCHGWFYTGWVISCNIKQPDCSHFAFGWSCESPMNYVLLDVTSVVFCALLLSSVFCVIEISQNIWIYHAQISNIFCCQNV